MSNGICHFLSGSLPLEVSNSVLYIENILVIFYQWLSTSTGKSGVIVAAMLWKHLYALVLSLTDQSLRFEVFQSTWAEFYAFTQARSIDPFHVCGNAANLEYKTKWIFASVKQSYCPVLQIGCIPTDVQGVYRSCVEHIEFIMLELCGIHRYGISSRYGTIAAISKFRRKYYFVACLSYFNELALIQNLRRKSSFKRIVEVH